VIEADMYKDIRRLYAVEGLSKRQIAKELSISRNTVKRYVDGGKTPWDSPQHVQRKCPVVTPQVHQFVKKILDEDLLVRKQQRHTAVRIWHRLKDELNFTGGETTIRQLVRRIKDQSVEAFVPLYFEPGEACQVDWGTAVADIGEQRVRVNLLCFRLCYSAAPFVMAFPSQRGEAFQEGHVAAMRFFGGVPRSLIYDNLPQQEITLCQERMVT
jgi:transposase